MLLALLLWQKYCTVSYQRSYIQLDNVNDLSLIVYKAEQRFPRFCSQPGNAGWNQRCSQLRHLFDEATVLQPGESGVAVRFETRALLPFQQYNRQLQLG